MEDESFIDKMLRLFEAKKNHEKQSTWLRNMLAVMADENEPGSIGIHRIRPSKDKDKQEK
jgi:hypothetical protein